MEIQNLQIARQLLRYAGQLQIYRHGKKVEVQNAQEMLKEDEELLSDKARELQAANPVGPTIDQPASGLNDRLQLSQLINRLRSAEPAPGTATPLSKGAQTQLTVERETISIEWEFTSANLPIDGLVRHNPNQAETDRYQFFFKDGMTFTIRDKWTNRSTTIWGDPHVDLSDVDGNANGEFSDLKGSNTHTTLMLLDGTRVTFTAQDNGVIEMVDLFKGRQHLHGTGAAATIFGKPGSTFFEAEVTQNGAGGLPTGDTVYAAGDGNDWVDAAGRRVWGITTGSGVATRPASVQTFNYQVKATRQSLAEWSG